MEIINLFGDGKTFIFESKKTTSAKIPIGERYQWHLMIDKKDSHLTFEKMTNDGDKGTRTFAEGLLTFNTKGCYLAPHNISLPRLDPSTVELPPFI